MYNIKNYLKIENFESLKTKEDYLESFIKDGNENVLLELIPEIIKQEELYENLAKDGHLFRLKSTVNKDTIKTILKELYNNQLSNKKHKNRKYYDEIIKLSNGTCPYCSIGQVFDGNGTLDHFLPKSKFLELAVSFINLVPCCADCNKNKGTRFHNTPNEQFVHPYFDDLPSERWLYVEFYDDFKYFKYIIKNENNIDDTLVEKIKFQFEKLNIYEKYKNMAIPQINEELSFIINNGVDINASLKNFNDSFKKVEDKLNTWKNALYYELKSLTVEDFKKLIGNFV